MRAGCGILPGLRIAIRLQHGSAAVVHRENHCGRATLFGDALHYPGRPAQAKPQTAGFHTAERPQQACRPLRGQGIGRKCSTPVIGDGIRGYGL
jgi:hypothetical protein